MEQFGDGLQSTIYYGEGWEELSSFLRLAELRMGYQLSVKVSIRTDPSIRMRQYNRHHCQQHRQYHRQYHRFIGLVLVF